jgi:hypothetical protein
MIATVRDERCELGTRRRARKQRSGLRPRALGRGKVPPKPDTIAAAPKTSAWCQELPRLSSSSSACAEPIAKQEEPSAFDIVRRVREEETRAS